MTQVSALRTAPLSPAQRQMWVVQQVNRTMRAYDLAWALRLRGHLDQERLACALAAIVARHEILRTTYGHIDGEPFQQVHPFAGFTLELADLTGVPAAAAESEKDREVRKRLARPLDLEQGPVFEAALLRLAPADQVLLLRVHHIAADASGLRVLYRELCQRYARPDEPAEPLPRQYADVAIEQNGLLARPQQESGLGYWRTALAGLGEPVTLPADRHRAETASFAGHREQVPMTAELSTAVRRLGARSGAPPFAVFLAAVATLLHLHNNTADVTVGTPASGRSDPDSQQLIGLFINLLVLRVRVGPAMRVRDLVRAARDVTLDAMTHQHVPFEEVVRAVNPDRSAQANPLFRTLLAYHPAEAGRAVGLAGLDVTWEPLATETSQFDLSFHITETASGFGGYLEYATDLFSRGAARRFARRLAAVLAAMAARPERRVADLPLLDEQEAALIRRLSTGTRRDTFLEPDLPGLLRRALARSPGAPAVRHGGEVLTYRQLHERAGEVAARLLRLKIPQERFVAIFAERSAGFVVGVLGAIQAGLPFVPIDPRQPEARVAGMLADIDPAAVLSAERDAAVLNGRAVVPLLPAPGEPWPGAPRPAARPDAAAYAIFTSGSTGRPKAAVNTGRGLVNRLLWMQAEFGLTAADVFVHKTPATFDVSVWEYLLPLICGAALVVAPPDAHREPAELTRLLADEQVTTVHFVPTMLGLFLDHPSGLLPASLRVLICSGEPLDDALARRAVTASRARLANLYGPAECAIDVTCWRQDDPPAGLVTIGRPIANVSVQVTDASGRLVPIGVAGELRIGGAAVGRGYQARPALTARAFTPGAGGGRVYRTGDRGRLLDTGEIEYLGRIDGQVKLHGVRIEPGEVEAALLRCNGVRAAAVIRRDDLPGGAVLAGYLTARPGVDAEAVRAHLRTLLPDALIPAHLVILDELPLTPSGKLDRLALPRPRLARDTTSAAAVPPASDAERRLLAVWAAVLSRTDLGVTDNFFAIGGDSVQAIRLSIRAAAAGLPRSVAQIFRHQTVRSLAAAPDNAATAVPRVQIGGATGADRDAGITDVYPAGPLQEHMLVRYQELDDPEMYLVQRLYQARGQLDVDRFRAAWQLAVDRHTMLRTSFDLSDLSAPRQLVHARAEIDFQYADWSALTRAQWQARLDHYLARQRDGGLRLSEPHPLAVGVFRTAAADYQWLVQFNYMCVDGWTLSILFEELGLSYRALIAGHEPDLEPAPPYRRYVEWAGSQSMPAAQAYWRGALGSHPPQRDLSGLLPGARREPPAVTAEGSRPESIGQRRLQLSAPDSKLLRAAAEGAGLTFNTLAQGAWALLIAQYTGQAEVTFGVTSTGRSSALPEMPLIVGAMLNTLPAAVAVQPAALARDWLAELQLQQAELREYEYTPTRRLNEWLGRPDTDLLYDTYLVFQNLASIRGPSRGLPGMTFPPADPFFRVKREYPLRIDIFPADRVGLNITYHCDRLDGATAERLLARFTVILTELAAGLSGRVGEVAPT